MFALKLLAFIFLHGQFQLNVFSYTCFLVFLCRLYRLLYSNIIPYLRYIPLAMLNTVLMKINLREKEFIACTILVSKVGESQQ